MEWVMELIKEMEEQNVHTCRLTQSPAHSFIHLESWLYPVCKVHWKHIKWDVLMLSEVHSVFICAVSLTSSVSLFSTLRLTAQPLPQICPFFFKFHNPTRAVIRRRRHLRPGSHLTCAMACFPLSPLKSFLQICDRRFMLPCQYGKTNVLLPAPRGCFKGAISLWPKPVLQPRSEYRRTL